jgi:hypothetical protein
VRDIDDSFLANISIDLDTLISQALARNAQGQSFKGVLLHEDAVYKLVKESPGFEDKINASGLYLFVVTNSMQKAWPTKLAPFEYILIDYTQAQLWQEITGNRLRIPENIEADCKII